VAVGSDGPPATTASHQFASARVIHGTLASRYHRRSCRAGSGCGSTSQYCGLARCEWEHQHRSCRKQTRRLQRERGAMTTRHFYSVILAASLLFATTASAQQYKYPFQNPNLPIEQRVNNILSLMTVDEKIAAPAQIQACRGSEFQVRRTSKACTALRLGGPAAGAAEAFSLYRRPSFRNRWASVRRGTRT
jgi:hypothetical protein